MLMGCTTDQTVLYIKVHLDGDINIDHDFSQTGNLCVSRRRRKLDCDVIKTMSPIAVIFYKWHPIDISF